MKFGVLALDYDGTIAHDGVLAPGVREAIRDIRRRGIVVVLVSGRRLPSLREAIGDLSAFSAIVAENGAIAYFPRSGRTIVLGAPPPPSLLDALGRRGVAFEAGVSVLEADAQTAPTVLDAIRETEQPLAILFNRGRLMVLPQAISKATGLRSALAALRLSVHNTVAIGDAENDHELLRVVELGVAVGWGSLALQAAADEVLPGSGPAAVGPFIRSLADLVQLPPSRIGRRELALGEEADGTPVALAVRGRNILIVGDPRSGKSWVAGLLCEQLILQSYCVCVIDPEGDYSSLANLPGVVVFGADGPPHPAELLRALRHPDVSVVADLCKLPREEKPVWVRAFLRELAALRRATGLPHRIVVDEAHYFLHSPDAHEVLDLGFGGYTLITHRTAMLHPEVLGATEGVISTQETDPWDLQALASRVAPGTDPATFAALFADLPIEEAVLCPGIEEAGGRARRFRVADRLTPHVRHRRKYLDVAVPDSAAFVFTENFEPTGQRAHTLSEFAALLRAISSSALAEHLLRGDFSRWVADVFGDWALAASIHEIETSYRAGAIADPGLAIARLIVNRYAPAPPAAHSP